MLETIFVKTIVLSMYAIFISSQIDSDQIQHHIDALNELTMILVILNSRNKIINDIGIIKKWHDYL